MILGRVSELLLIARCALALVFAIAALGKLADLTGFRRTVAEFGVSPALTRVGAIAVPVIELAVAALLVPTATARIGACAALLLLLAFCVAIGRVLRRGEQPDCNCLGRAHSSPVSGATLARTAALAVVAGLVVAGGAGSGLGEALAGLDGSPLAILLVLGVVVQAWFSWQLFRQHGRLLDRVRALEAATEEAPTPALPVIHRHRLRRHSVDKRLRALEG